MMYAPHGNIALYEPAEQGTPTVALCDFLHVELHCVNTTLLYI